MIYCYPLDLYQAIIARLISYFLIFTIFVPALKILMFNYSIKEMFLSSFYCFKQYRYFVFVTIDNTNLLSFHLIYLLGCYPSSHFSFKVLVLYDCLKLSLLLYFFWVKTHLIFFLIIFYSSSQCFFAIFFDFYLH